MIMTTPYLTLLQLSHASDDGQHRVAVTGALVKGEGAVSKTQSQHICL